MKRILIWIWLFATATPAAMAATARLPFVEDDSARALAEANRRHLPVFVDVWAPW